MGIENMRRWPMYVTFAICILLSISLFNSWGIETELQSKLRDLGSQLQDCSSQQTSCTEESLTLIEQRDRYLTKVNELEKNQVKLLDNVADYAAKLTKFQGQVNETKQDLEKCTTELQSLTNLQITEKDVMKSLRIAKDTLTLQLAERKKRIEDLEKEVLLLKAALTTKSVPNPSVALKVTPAAQPPKISPALNAPNVIDEAVLENNAKEDIEDPNALNEDSNDFDAAL